MTTNLLVEDATDLAQIIERELKAVSYDVLHAVDGVAALAMHARATGPTSSSSIRCSRAWTAWRCCARSARMTPSPC